MITLILGTISYQRERAARSEADSSRTAESVQRQQAQSDALRARQFQYASDMNLAHQAVGWMTAIYSVRSNSSTDIGRRLESRLQPVRVPTVPLCTKTA